MARPTKEFRYLSVKLDKYVSDRFTKFCKETARNKTAALEMILTKYLDEYDKKKLTEKD